ncbi:UDP-glucose:glycoprotein glucosyltransferase-domain-containing protein [Gongronella butleri]|nr:UDP-glucose:glycoprotein glucosyltransferase-domain-containing protein [Gongronella butleri]
MVRLVSAGLASTLLLSCVSARQEATPPVELSMLAPWQAPDALVQVAETLGKVAPKSYWDYIQDLTKVAQMPLTPQQQYENANLLAKNHIDSQLAALLRHHLALHLSAPLIEAQHQEYTYRIAPSVADYDSACAVWVNVDGNQACTVSALDDLLKTRSNDAPTRRHVALPDHVYGKSDKPLVHLHTASFAGPFDEVFRYLRKRVDDAGDIAFSIHYKPAAGSNSSTAPLYLTGYGVELAIKNTDYLVIDDRASAVDSDEKKQDDDESDSTAASFIKNLGKKVNHMLFETDEKPTIKPMTPEEIKPLSMKAAQFILNAKEPLTALAQLAQDFPKHAHKISNVQVSDDVAMEIAQNQRQFIKAGTNVMWLNGMPLEDSETNPFFIARALVRERQLVQQLEELGMTRRQALELVSEDPTPSSGTATTPKVFDTRDDAEHPAVLWMNDIESDAQYTVWPSELSSLLRAGYPGQMRVVRKNLFNVIMMEDLATAESLKRITQEISSIIQQGAPLRVGIVPYLDDHNGPTSLMAKAWVDLNERKGLADSIIFLEEVLREMTKAKLEIVTEREIANAFEKVDSRDAWVEIELASPPQGVQQFLARLGLDDTTHGKVMFLNGQFIEYTEQRPWMPSLMTVFQSQMQSLTRSVYMGEVGDDDNVYDFFLNQPDVAATRNAYITVSDDRPLKMVDASVVQQNIHYVTSEADGAKIGNVWVAGDMNSHAGLKMLLNALEFLDANKGTRLAVIHVPSTDDQHQEDGPLFSDVLYHQLYIEKADFAQLRDLAATQAAHWQETDVQGTPDERLVKPLAPGSPVVEQNVHKQVTEQWNAHYAMVGTKVTPQQACIVVNGRIVGPFAAAKGFSVADMTSLWQVELKDRISPMQARLEQLEIDLAPDAQHVLADKLTFLVSLFDKVSKSMARNVVLATQKNAVRDRYYARLGSDFTRVTAGDASNAYAEIGVLLDPLSEDAQAWAGMLLALADIDGVVVDIRLNSRPKLDKLPLTRFYRSVVDTDWHFDGEGQRTVPTAYFDALPMDPLYTLGVHTIEPWQVTVQKANMDLDNIKLVDQGVKAVYALEHILIEGHCIDDKTRAPPRGLQFNLDSSAATTGTIVMANLGYFQLKANPGHWQLTIRPGRSSDVYHLDNIATGGDWDKSADPNQPLILDSFEGLRVFAGVQKNPGMDDQEVLENIDDQAKSGIFSSFSQKVFGKKSAPKDHAEGARKQADINIFSVASGHLYERFLAIMTASVMKHTDSTVKFWFIENFLSPSFKDFLPELANSYGFEYELVTYKWPSWLNAQTEKQRTIWGYKILFLDVLFPLDLEKVIFVDADQIVRTDMKELVDLDLQGAPYGYTPFCSDRREMDGFRFWNQGYWKDHLAGRPYHISALYVVDLVRFRQMAAGDRLRATYQQLSVDPNSLANLDQDLPNNMIHAVPIFSLPQEWLWCETWCSDESLTKAKTIDLCNNPLTKEPKLDRARRQVPEWATYDSQIEAIRQRFLQQQQTQSLVATPAPSTKIHPTHVKDEL